DQIGAAAAGVRCFLLPPRGQVLRYTPPANSAASGARAAYLANRLPTAPAAALGWEVAAPLLTGFTAWLESRCGAANAAGGGRLVFLARDMYLTRQAFLARYPHRRADYLKVSRRSLCPALLVLGESARDVLLDALPREILTVAEILNFCGFEAPVKLSGFTPDAPQDLRTRPVAETTQALVTAVFALAAGPAGEPIRRQAAFTKAYLEGFGLAEPGALLVDIGSGGTTQRALEAILAAPLHGCYLACDARLHQHLPPARAAVYLFGGAAAPLWFWAGQPLLEHLLSEPCGATVGYCQGADGRPRPVVADGQCAPLVQVLQKGAMDAVAGMAASLPWPPPTATEAIAPFLALVQDPCLCDADLLGALTLEDGICYRLAEPRPLRAYLAKPGQLGADVQASRWKVGFLKRLFRLPLPYGQLYAFMKNKKDHNTP
ncbi:MAG: hypothetical protein PHO10_10705, partial [Gemmiger sp.]|nr:hypothetical protein [Gemmiger sp.]